MRITSIFAMGKNGEMGTDSRENFFLPWKRSYEDMKFLCEKIDELGYQGAKEPFVGKNILIATYATYSLLPSSMRRRIKENEYKVILLTTDIHKKVDEQYSLLTMGSFRHTAISMNSLRANINNELFAKQFKQALSLIVEPTTIRNVLYLGSPHFIKEMMSISDKTYITVFDEVLDVRITHGIEQTGLLQIEGSPRRKIKTIENGYIMEAATKCYNINNY